MTQADFSTMTDEQLLLLCRRSDAALEELLSRYLRTVKRCARSFFLVGAEESDLVQEGMIGLLSAVRSYEPSAQSSFPAYAVLCIRRRMISAVRSANAERNAALNGAVSLQGVSPSCTAEDLPENDPETLILDREHFQSQLTALELRLSSFEREVLPLFLEGYSGREIALRLKRPRKSADNAIQRIRAKAATLFPGR